MDISDLWPRLSRFKLKRGPAIDAGADYRADPRVVSCRRALLPDNLVWKVLTVEAIRLAVSIRIYAYMPC